LCPTSLLKLLLDHVRRGNERGRTHGKELNTILACANQEINCLL
jgi:hypothetical protein